MKYSFLRLAIVAVCLVMCIGLLRSIIENLQRTDFVSQRQIVLNKEEQKNSTLQERLREATSASFIEQEARNKLGLVRTGDTVVLIGSSLPTQGDGQTGSSGDTNISRWQKWWRLFF